MRGSDHATILSPSFHSLCKERLAQWPAFCVLNLRPKIPGGSSKKIGRGCAARLLKPLPYFRPKSVIFLTLFQTWSKIWYPISDLKPWSPASVTSCYGTYTVVGVMHLSMGMGWGFDCLCWPWGRAFHWSCSPRGGDIWIFLRPTWRYLTADSDEKDWDRTYVSRFHASRMRRTVWKDQEVMEANENKRRLSGFHCFVFKFRLF